MRTLRGSSPSEILAAVRKGRLEERTRGTESEELDEIHRRLILKDPVLTNDMYVALVRGCLAPEATSAFFTEYYHGSGRGFYREVICKAIRHFKEPLWRQYIARIIEEESKPRVHYEMFADFLEACDVAIGAPTVATRFNERMLAGFTRSLPYSLGYSLAIEVEADYQIALLAFSLAPVYEEAMLATEWFDVHLDAGGEEMHARLCLEAIERLGPENLAEVRAGFLQSCRDTCAYMNTIAALSLSRAKRA
jgi:hypothetical protein